MPDWLNRLILLGWHEVSGVVEKFGIHDFFASHLSLWVVLCSLFDNFTFCLYFEEPAAAKQAADERHWIEILHGSYVAWQ